MCDSPAGPKGVINDWRKFKQLENEQRMEQQKEMERLVKKLSMTCKSHLDEEAEREKQKKLQDKIAGKVSKNDMHISRILYRSVYIYRSMNGTVKQVYTFIPHFHLSFFVCQMTLRVDEDEDDDDDDESFLQQYRLQRMEEMRRQLCGGQRFEKVIDIPSGEEFLRAIDEEGKNTLVLVHIYEPEVPACQAMEGSLLCLALQYPMVTNQESLKNHRVNK